MTVCPNLVISIPKNLNYNNRVYPITSPHLSQKIIPQVYFSRFSRVVSIDMVFKWLHSAWTYLIRLCKCIHIEKHASWIIGDDESTYMVCRCASISMCKMTIMCTSWISVCNTSFFCILYCTSFTAGHIVEQQEMTSYLHDIVFPTLSQQRV